MSRPSTFRVLIAMLRGLRLRYRRWEAERLLRRSVELHPEAFHNFILERAAVATFQTVKQHLTARGTRLCDFCTATNRPLRRVGGVFACPEHLDQVRASEAAKERRATLPDPARAAA